MGARGMGNRVRVARRGVVGLAAAGVLSLVVVGGAAAQDIAAAGNGGTSGAAADGGLVAIGDLNTGGSTGSDITVGDIGTPDVVVIDKKTGKPVVIPGSDPAVAIDAGDTASATTLDLGSAGGTGITDASGGDENFAFLSAE